jgi:hypothetical protein
MWFTILSCTALYCPALHYTVLHCTILSCTALYCHALHYIGLHCTILSCIALHCTVLHCTALACSVYVGRRAICHPSLLYFARIITGRNIGPSTIYWIGCNSPDCVTTGWCIGPMFYRVFQKKWKLWIAYNFCIFWLTGLIPMFFWTVLQFYFGI